MKKVLGEELDYNHFKWQTDKGSEVLIVLKESYDKRHNRCD